VASRSPQSHAKRARELAVREKRELKRAKKAEAKLQAAQPEEDTATDVELDGDVEDSEEETAADDA
jgi:hypothetical protein